MKKAELSIQSLRLFAALSEERGLVKAGRRLGMSQSGASHALASLQENLGTTLFVREPVGLRLTETAERLLPHVRDILNALDMMRAETSATAGLHHGSLCVCSIPSVAGTFLPALLREYAHRYPGIDLSLYEGTDAEVATWVQQRIADIGFAALPVEGATGIRIVSDEWLALVPAHGNEHLRSISLKQLARQRFLMSEGGCEPMIRELFTSAKLHIEDAFSVREMATLKAMVAEGIGVSIVPSLAAQGATKGARAVPLCPQRFRDIGLIVSRPDNVSPSVRAWIALVSERFNFKLPTGGGKK
jgi:DNA-binding transcriptional LysR family regulator